MKMEVDPVPFRVVQRFWCHRHSLQHRYFIFQGNAQLSKVIPLQLGKICLRYLADQGGRVGARAQRRYRAHRRARTKLVERARAGDIVDPVGVDAALHTEFSDENLGACASKRSERSRCTPISSRCCTRAVRVRRCGGKRVHGSWPGSRRDQPWRRLIRPAAGLATSLGTDFSAVTVRNVETTSAAAELLQRCAALTSRLGRQMLGLNCPAVAPVLARYARDNLVTEIPVTRGSRGGERAGVTIRELTGALSDVGLHVLAAE
jgi:hypothetical protein